MVPRAITPGPALQRPSHRTSIFRRLWMILFASCRPEEPYRPEKHYMRGPGPKWHEKHRGSLTRARATPNAPQRGAGSAPDA